MKTNNSLTIKNIKILKSEENKRYQESNKAEFDTYWKHFLNP